MTRRVASRTDLIVTRNGAAAERLRAMGVSAPLLSTADNAFTFQSRLADHGWLQREWPRAAGGVVGLATVNFHLFPAVLRPWGRRERCYKWPYYFSSSAERRAAGEELAQAWAELADRVVESTGKAVALICMEQLDEAIAGRVHSLMRHPADARVFSARREDASRMTALLRGLDLLVTSRYHAAVLSLAAAVPQIALGHDTRLDTLYRDLGLREEWFLTPDRLPELGGLVERLLAAPDRQREALRRGHAEHLGRARQNRRLLARFVADHFPGAEASGGAAWVA
jgi:polysaccharide pyruvyl transferase WcaK-like protein